ncbi:hypothetical protein C8J56DRAFT_890683 [Mycena floridula]|nr:hypothetical protein C8J56DRAFT_890683 [Mycena floridula]
MGSLFAPFDIIDNDVIPEIPSFPAYLVQQGFQHVSGITVHSRSSYYSLAVFFEDEAGRTPLGGFQDICLPDQVILPLEQGHHTNVANIVSSLQTSLIIAQYLNDDANWSTQALNNIMLHNADDVEYELWSSKIGGGLYLLALTLREALAASIFDIGPEDNYNPACEIGTFDWTDIKSFVLVIKPVIIISSILLHDDVPSSFIPELPVLLTSIISNSFFTGESAVSSKAIVSNSMPVIHRRHTGLRQMAISSIHDALSSLGITNYHNSPAWNHRSHSIDAEKMVVSMLAMQYILYCLSFSTDAAVLGLQEFVTSPLGDGYINANGVRTIFGYGLVTFRKRQLSLGWMIIIRQWGLIWDPLYSDKFELEVIHFRLKAYMLLLKIVRLIDGHGIVRSHAEHAAAKSCISEDWGEAISAGLIHRLKPTMIEYLILPGSPAGSSRFAQRAYGRPIPPLSNINPNKNASAYRLQKLHSEFIPL